jgi:hypothetical protein
MGKFFVKCDTCKKNVKTTDNIIESYQGIGMCFDCRKKWQSGERKWFI